MTDPVENLRSVLEETQSKTAMLHHAKTADEAIKEVMRHAEYSEKRISDALELLPDIYDSLSHAGYAAAIEEMQKSFSSIGTHTFNVGGAFIQTEDGEKVFVEKGKIENILTRFREQIAAIPTPEKPLLGAEVSDEEIAKVIWRATDDDTRDLAKVQKVLDALRGDFSFTRAR